MKKLIILSLPTALLAAPSWRYKQGDLDNLKATNSCSACNLNEADLNDTDLKGAFLEAARLKAANLFTLETTQI